MESKRASSGRWQPPGSYPGDRSYLGFFVAAVLFAVLGILAIGPSIASVPLAFLVALLLGIVAFNGLHNARRGRFILWPRLLEQLEVPVDAVVADIGSRDGIATTAIVSSLPGAHVLVVVTSLDTAELIASNIAEVGASDSVTVKLATLDVLPAENQSVDVIISDSSEQLVKNARVLAAAMDEIARISAPGAQLLLVVGGRARSIRSALVEAGAVDVRIERVLGTWVSGYRLVRARFPFIG